MIQGLGLQGSGLKNAGLQGSKTKISGLEGSTSSALGLRAPLWSTILIRKNSIFNAKSNTQIKKSVFPINFLNPSSRLYYLLLFKSGLNIKLE